MKKFNALDTIPIINKFRIEIKDNSFSKNELKQVLKKAKFPSNDVFINELRRRPFIKQIGKDQFKFGNNPIYFEWINHVYRVYKMQIDKYKQTYKKKQMTIFLVD